MIGSIKKVKVTEVSEIQPYTEDNAEAVSHQYGVYLIFTQMDNKTPSGYRDRDYCWIGVASGFGGGVAGELQRTMKKHMKSDEGCKLLDDHYFQVLACNDRSEAARLEKLFHVWHLNYPIIDIKGKQSQPAEPRGEPSAEKEPDFFEVVSD